VCKVEVKRLVQREIEGRVKAHQNLATPAGSSGGATSSSSGSLGVERSRKEARVHEGGEAIL
jgi:hypothetical protein